MHSIKLSRYKRGIKYDNCLLGATIVIKNSNKDNWVYTGYGIASHGGDWWIFGNGTAKNVIIFGFDSSSSSHVVDNFLILGKGPTFGINGNFGSIKIKADNKNVNFPTRFCLESISDVFSPTESREVSSNGIVYDFSVYYNSIDKSDILNIQSI